MSTEHILIATDGSEGSRHSLQRGISLAGVLGAGITVLLVLERSSSDWLDAGGRGGRKIRFSERLEAAEKRLRKEVREAAAGAGVESAVKVTTGKPFVEIIQAARAENAGLVILGAHGRNFFKDPFIGSTAERVVRNGDRSVLVVKKPPGSRYQRVLVGVDFSEGSKNALETALQIAPDADFHVLHAYQYLTRDEEKRRLKPFKTSEDYLRQIKALAETDMKQMLSTYDLNARNLKPSVKFGYPPSIIRNEARRLKPDLCVVGAMGKSDMRYILLGSTASHALAELDSDVLVVRTGPSLRFELP